MLALSAAAQGTAIGAMPSPEEIPDTLTLARALLLAESRNPELKALTWEYRAREARSKQEGAVQNPEASLELEDFSGSGELGGVDGLQTTLGLNQTLQLGGKRGKRKRLATLDRDLAGWDRTLRAREIRAEATQAFIDLLAAQERAALLEKSTTLASELLEKASMRHRAGKAPASEEMKARIAVSMSHAAWDRAVQDGQSAKALLAFFWGGDTGSFRKAAGDLRAVPGIPTWENLVRGLDEMPALARWETELAQRKAAIALESAQRIPDVTVGAGVRHSNASGDAALVTGLSLPIPLFNRNQGGIEEARSRMAKAEQSVQAERNRLLARLRTLHQALTAHAEEIGHLRDEILPEAEKVQQFTREAYGLGKLSYLEVLDSQRTLLETNQRYIEVLSSYGKDWAELESLAGEDAAFAEKEKGAEP